VAVLHFFSNNRIQLKRNCKYDNKPGNNFSDVICYYSFLKEIQEDKTSAMACKVLDKNNQGQINCNQAEESKRVDSQREQE
jgi:hypothetical protein